MDAEDETNFNWMKQALAPVGNNNLEWILEATKTIYTTGANREGQPETSHIVNGKPSMFLALYRVYASGVQSWAVPTLISQQLNDEFYNRQAAYKVKNFTING